MSNISSRTRSKETNGNLALQQLVRRQAIVPSALPVVDLESNKDKNYDSRDMNLNMNVSENPYYIDENYFNTLKSFHLTDVGYEGRHWSIWIIRFLLDKQRMICVPYNKRIHDTSVRDLCKWFNNLSYCFNFRGWGYIPLL